MGLSSSLYFIGLMIGSVVTGGLADTWGRRPTLLVGGCWFFLVLIFGDFVETSTNTAALDWCCWCLSCTDADFWWSIWYPSPWAAWIVPSTSTLIKVAKVVQYGAILHRVWSSWLHYPALAAHSAQSSGPTPYPGSHPHMFCLPAVAFNEYRLITGLWLALIKSIECNQLNIAFNQINIAFNQINIPLNQTNIVL